MAVSREALFPPPPSQEERWSRARSGADVFSALVAWDTASAVGSAQWGEVLEGRLEPTDASSPLGRPVDLWQLRLRQSRDVRLEATASGPLTVLLFSGPPDDPGSLLLHQEGPAPPEARRLEAGYYTVAISAPVDGRTVDYALRLVADSVVTGDLPVLRTGQAVHDSLRTGDSVLPDSAHVREYAYAGRSGERLSLRLRSDAFAPSLVVLQGPERGSAVFLGEATAGETASEARLERVLPESGTVYLLATSAAPGATGAFELQLDAVPEEVMVFDNAASSRERYALLVGVSDYPGDDHDLLGPEEDVLVMRDLLVERFEFDPSDIVVLRDGEATRENVANGVLQHLGQAGPEGLALFYFSGAGLRLGRDLGLLGATDPDRVQGSDRALRTHGPDGSGVLLDEELSFLAASLSAGRSLLILDTCFQGPREADEPVGATGPLSKCPVGDGPEVGEGFVAMGVRPPPIFLSAEPRVTARLSRSPVTPDALPALAPVLTTPERSLVWMAASPGSRASGAPAAGGPSAFTGALARLLRESSEETTLADIQAALSGISPAGTGDGTRELGPRLLGEGLERTLADFFR